MVHATLLSREIDKLKERILFLGGLVEEIFRDGVKSVKTLDKELAQAVVERDDEVDRLEVEIEEDCLKILALHQPVASDLRFIVTALKVNNDLERIGNLAGNLAGHALAIAELPLVQKPFDFDHMAELAGHMLKGCLDALVERSTKKAHKVVQEDDRVDEMNKEMYRKVEWEILNHPDRMDSYMHYVGISKCLERIADLSTNIAEDVIYLTSGEIARH